VTILPIAVGCSADCGSKTSCCDSRHQSINDKEIVISRIAALYIKVPPKDAQITFALGVNVGASGLSYGGNA
jgi:hypothetical protein